MLTRGAADPHMSRNLVREYIEPCESQKCISD